MQNRPLILILVAIAATGLLAFVITGICNAGLKDRFEIESVAPRDSASEGSKIDIGDAEWTSGRVGFSTIYVPFVLRAKGGPVTLDIEGGRFTILASVQVDGTDVAKTQVNQNRYEFVAPPTEKTAKGVLKLSQPSDKEPFSISVRYDNETKKKSFEPPLDTQFPPDTARSDNIDLGPIERTGSKIQIRFSLKERSGDKVRVLWRAPVRSTFFESASFEGQKLADEQVKSVSSESEKELMLPPTGKSGTIVYQQTGEVDFRVWIVHGEGTASLMVPRGVRDDNEPGDKPTLPPTVTPVLETAKNMVDLNAFPFQAREPVQSRVLYSLGSWLSASESSSASRPQSEFQTPGPDTSFACLSSSTSRTKKCPPTPSWYSRGTSTRRRRRCDTSLAARQRSDRRPRCPTRARSKRR